MFHACLPVSFGVKAFFFAIFLINLLPSSSLSGKTPYALLFGHKPDYSMLCTFRCLCFSYLRNSSPHKLSLKSVPCVFLGYNTFHKGFRCFDRQTCHVYVSRHVKNFEIVFPYVDGSFPNMSSTNDYNIFSKYTECVSNHSISIPSDSVISPSLSSSPCLPYNDSLTQILSISADSSIQQPSLSIPSSSIVASTSPESSQPSLLTNRYPMVIRGKAGVFKPWTQHVMTICSSSQPLQALFAFKEPRGFKSFVKHPEWLSAIDF